MSDNIEEQFDESGDSESGKKESRISPPIHVIDAYWIVIADREFNVLIKKDDKFITTWHYIEPVTAFKAIHREMLKAAIRNHALQNKNDTLLGLIHMINNFNEKYLNEVVSRIDTPEFRDTFAELNKERLAREAIRIKDLEDTKKSKKRGKAKDISDADFIGVTEEPEEPEEDSE
jgi:hypothetical protein